MTVSDSIKANVRAVLLSKTDGKGVLVSTFLRDYKSIIGETLMYKNMGYDSLESFIKQIPDVCRLEYAEKEMAYKLFGIAKPNTYASSFMKRAEGHMTDTEDSGDRQRNKKSGRGDKVALSSDLNEEWIPNSRGHITLCFPNKPGNGMDRKEDVAIAFSALGEVAEINQIPQMTFVRFTNQTAAKKAVQIYGNSLGLRRADERKPGEGKKNSKPSSSSRGQERNGFRNSPNDDNWDEEPEPVKRDTKQFHVNKNDTVLSPPRENTEKIQVYVGNLPAEIDENEVAQLMRPYVHVGIRIKSQGKSMKTYAFVDFTDVSEAKRMIRDLNETVLKGRNLKIRFANQHLHDTAVDDREGFATPTKGGNEQSNLMKGSIEKQFEQLAVHRGNEIREQQLSTLQNLSRTVTNDYAARGSACARTPTKKDSVSPASHHSVGSSPLRMPHLENIDSRNGFDNFDMPHLEEIQPSGRDLRRGKGHSPQVRRNLDLDDMPPLEKTQLPLSPGMPVLENTSSQGRYGSQNGPSGMPVLEKTSPRGTFGYHNGPPPPLEHETVQLFLGNFPYGTKEVSSALQEDLMHLLAQFGVIRVTMMNQEVKNRSTYAFATCCDMLHAEKAIQLCDQSFFRGRKLTVTLANPVSQLPPASSSTSSLNLVGAPLANITCTVGGDTGRQVHLEGVSRRRKAVNPLPHEYSYSFLNHSANIRLQQHYGGDQGYYDGNANMQNAYSDTPTRAKYGDAGLSVKTDFNYRRLTCLLKDYSMMVSKLRGEDRFRYAPGTTVAVMVTHVENDKVFWGQVIKDSVGGQNRDLPQLMNITHLLQDDSCRHLPIKGLGRCIAQFNGEWFRGWCMHISHREGQDFCDVLYVDYGNTDNVPKSECYLTDTRKDVWTLPPIARPFKLPEPQYDLESLTDKVVVFEVTEPGSSINNFMTTVIGKFDQ